MGTLYFLTVVLVSFLSYSKGQLTSKEKQSILDFHNDARRQMGAPNMRKMGWSEELARIAEDVAQTCSNDQTSQSRLSAALGSQFSWVGENRHLVNLTDKGDALVSAFNCWYEGEGCSSDRKEQILYPDSFLLGCGAHYFPVAPLCRSLGTGVHVVCFYAPGAPASYASLTGDPCTRCPEDAEECDNNLCVPPGGLGSVPDDEEEEQSTTTPRVYWRSPWYSSFGGGTLITIAGIGFADDQFSTTDSPNVGNRVEFYNEDAGITLPCVVERYYTTNTRILCRTSASPDDVQRTYNLEVTVNGRKLSDIAGSTYCYGKSEYCAITYREFATPRISTISPHAKIPGEDPGNVTFIGTIRSYLVADTQEPNEEDEDSNLQTVDRLLLGGELCDPYSGDGETTYGGYIGSNGYGGVSCRIDSMRIDSMNASLVLSLYGLSKVKLEDYSIDNKLRKYQFQTHPDITGVEPSTGSPAGGTLITIYGKHFTDPNGDIKAFVSGVPCRVVNYTSTSVQCVTGPALPQSAVYPGGRGVVREVWTDMWQGDPQHLINRPYGYPNASYNNWAVQERFYRHYSYTPEFGEQNYFNQRYTGFFVPPIDSFYTFNFISDDLLDLYLSPNSRREDKELIAYSNSWTRNSYNYFASQTSSPKYLKAGQPYYIEALQSQYGGPWYIGVAAKIHNLTWTEDYALADHEEQIIRISSTVIKETQQLSVTATPKIQVIVLELEEEEDIQYKLSYNSGMTPLLYESANASVIEDTLNSLDSIGNIGKVSVRMKRTEEEVQLTILFLSTEINLSDIIVTEHDNYTSEVIQDARNPLHEFSLSYGSKTTKLVNATSTDEQVQEEVYGLFTTDCQVGDKGDVFFYDSYEGRTSPIFNGGSLDSSVEPYCGRFSIRNPVEVFENNNGYSTVTVSMFGHRYACFHVKGTIPNSRLRIRARQNPTATYRNYAIAIEDDQINGEWKRVCVDMWQFLYDRFEQQHLTFIIRRIFFDSSSTSFWVDEFRITSSKPSVVRTSLAARPNGVYVNTVEVEKQQLSVPVLFCPSGSNSTDCRLGVTTFTISYGVHQCGYKMPLIMVSHPRDIHVTRLKDGSPPVGGNFSISFEGKTVSYIAADAEESDIKSSLENAFGSDLEVTRGGSCSGYQWTIRWSDRGGDLPLMEADGVRLTGYGVKINVLSKTDGGVWLRPLRGDMLRLPELNPQVEVSVNGIPASCRNRNCTFTFLGNETARIMSVSPAEGGQDGSEITINGSGFPGDYSMVTVTIGDEICEVQSINETQITCIPTANQAGVYPIKILVDGLGFALPYGDEDVLFKYQLEVTDIEPDAGTVFGGNLVTFSGVGFPDFNSSLLSEYSRNTFGECFHPSAYVLFDGIPCFIQSSNFTHLSCKPQAHSEESVRVMFIINDVDLVLDDAYEYSSNFTSTVSSVSPATGPVFGGTEVTIYGENFHDDVSVEIGGVACNITSVSNSSITCITMQHSPGKFEVLVFSTEYGVSYLPSFVNDSFEELQITLEQLLLKENKTGNKTGQSLSSLSKNMTSNETGQSLPFLFTWLPTFSYELLVSSLSPRFGSLSGGTRVTITGKGFGEDTVVMETLRGQRCDISSMSYEEINCTMPSTTGNYMIKNTGSHPVLGQYYAWEPSTIEISVGSTVMWKWTGSMLRMSQEFEVHQTSSLQSTDPIGFQSQSSIDGTFSYTFTKPGTYYYSTDLTNTICSFCTMAGTITVKPLEELVTTLKVSVNGFPSLYNLNYSSLSSVATFESGSGEDEKCLSWADAAINESLTDPPVFVYSECYTPIVHSIMSEKSTLLSEYTIYGARFGDESENTQVSLWGVSCDPSSVTYKSITCKLNQTSSPLPFEPLPLSIHNDNLGYALLLGEDIYDRSISLNPVITNIQPSQGSLLGGNVLTIHGRSFIEENLQVHIGNSECSVIEVFYEWITCQIPKLAQDVSVQNASLPVRVAYNSSANKSAVCYNMDNCSYTYTIDYTPMVFSVTPTEVVGEESAIITISGALLEEDSKVMVGSRHECVNVTKLDDENVTCILYPIPAAEYSLSVLVAEYGYAEVDDAVIVSRLQVNSVSPMQGSIRGGTIITISGSGFSDVLTENRVRMGEQGLMCEVIGSSYSTINCSTPDFGANGTVSIAISVTVADTNASVSKRQVEDFEADGFEFDFSLESTPMIASISPSSGQEGDSVTISGNSFIDTPSNIIVTIGDSECSVTSSTETSITCTLGQNFVGTFTVKATIAGKGRANGTVTFSYTLRVSGIDPTEGSFAGQNTLTVNGVGFRPTSSFVTICDKQCTPSNTPPSLTSLSCIVPSFAEIISNDTNISSKNCTVVVSSMNTNVTLENAYTLKQELTPFVTSINDTRGGTAGGTIIKLGGTGFNGSPNVTIAGIKCTVIEYDDNEIICMTGAIGRTLVAEVMVHISGKGYAIVSNDVYFYYVDLWSSIFTWGGERLPVEGDFVIVGAGQTLVLDTITPILKILLIQGGELIFDDVSSENGIQLHSELILITDGGSLKIGTESHPYMNKAEIVMYGNVLSTELPLFGAKTLAVRNGTVDFHGKPITNTWTRLSATAEPGDSTILVQDDVSDWEVDGKIVIASTSYSQRENEELTISSIGSDGKTIHLKEPLAYRHIFYEQTIEGRFIQTSAEVGYLTRNVVFRGNRNEEWDVEYEACEEEFDPGQFAVQTCFNGRFGAETVGDQFGGQLMLHKGPRDKVVGRIEYTEFTHVGQAFRLGRYPIHFHLNGDVSDSYVRGNAIHHTFNRAVTIHAVDYLLVEKNVAFDIKGHAYFLEDGIEQGNIIQDNLGVFVKASSSLLNVDITPATFWVVNPNNTLRRNAAAGGSHFGFWYRLPANPTGPSFTTAVEPLHLPLAEFSDNTAHSFGWYGIWIFPSYHPGGAHTCNERTPAVFKNFLSWRNVRGVEFSEVGAVQLVNSTMLDNEIAGVEYTTVTAAWGKQGALIEDTLIVAHSELRDYDDKRVRGGDAVCTGSGIKTPHTYYLTVSNVTFVNFNESNCFALQACSHCRTQQGGFETRFENLTFTNSPNIATWKWEHEQVFRDMDGTLTGTVGGALLPWMSALPQDSCQLHAAGSSGSVAGAICDASVQFNRFALTNPSPSSLTFRQLNATNIHGTVTLDYVFKRLALGRGYMAILPNKLEYTLEWSEGDRFTNISYSSLYSGVTGDDYLFIRHDFPREVDMINVNGRTKNASIDKPDPEVSTTGDWFSNSNDTSVTYFVGGTSNCPTNIPVQFTTYRCFYEDCIPPPPPEPSTPPPDGRPNVTYMWSDPSIWPNGVVPTVNDTDITINSSFYVLVDEGDIIPRIRRLTIYGSLEILDKVDRVIQAELIIIDEFGQLIAGSPDEPYQHQLDFVLNGNLESPIYRLPNGGPVLGAKAIGVFGRLSLHAQEREQTWTFLTSTALAGDTEINIESPVDWRVGETIVISSTSFEANEAEEARVRSVSDDGLTITLDSPLASTHLGGQHNTDSCTVTISAEVGLLTRNIRVLGTLPDSTDSTADSEAYGCRVLVSTYISNAGIQYAGSAQLSGVEFKGCGQEGFVESFDPRYSLAFLNTGTVTGNSSYVTNCSVHDGYNVGIGVYGTNGISLMNNVVHNTVGTSIDVRGRGHSVVNNLAVVAQFPGTYRGRDEPWNFEWTANYELTGATDLTLYGNSAAGGARAGYHTNGENCLVEGFIPQWRNNIAHSTLMGIHLPYPDGHVSGTTRGCSALHNFHIYSAYHYGIFSFSRAGIQISDCTLVNNYAAVFTAVIGPPALSHAISEKTVTISDTRIISSIHNGDSVANCTAYSHKPVIAYHPRSHSGIQTPTRGHVGIILTSFTSGSGGFPKFPWTALHNYPAISGHTTLRNVTFCKFGMHCGSRREVALMTDPTSEDCQHPVELHNTELIDVDPESKFFNHNPNLGSINPSDCVDMDCDGLKKILIRDLDGSFIGSQNGLNTLTSNSALEWDGNPRRGLGDYRIPRTMLAEPDGGMIDPDQLYPNKGIYRGNNQCTFNSNWNSYHCTGIDHLMMVVESLDADTEVRRLSPIGIGAAGYIDLVNGPQDNGWCGGYTCQERISTFYTIVATGLEYSIGLASTNPQDMRLIILNAESTQKVLIGLFYNSPQRLDIFADARYIAPTNGYFDDEGNLRYSRGSTSMFLPTLSNSHGANFYDRTYKKLYFVIEGSKPITIMTQSVIQLGINLPAVTVDEFFETNLIQNLALLLNIPQNRIRIVNVVSESSRKRQASSTRVEIEIGSPPANETQQVNRTQTTGGNGTYYYNTTQTVATDEQFKELSEAATRTAEIIQTGALSDSIGVMILSASLTPPEPEVVDPTGGVRATEDTGGPQPGDPGTENRTTFSEQQAQQQEAVQNSTEPISLSIPTALSSVAIPSTGIEGLTLSQPIIIAMHDGNGDVVVNLGIGVAWRLQVSIISGPDGAFLTNNSVDMENGRATFSDLMFSHAGSYSLRFTVSYPTDADFTLDASTRIEISTRQLYIKIETQPPTEANTTFGLYPYARISIRDRSTDQLALNLGWREREWSAVATVIESSTGRQYGSSHKSEIVDGYAMFTDISIDKEGVYVLKFSLETDPQSTEAELPVIVDSVEIDVKQLPFTRFEIVFNEEFEEVIGNEVEQFKEAFVRHLTQEHQSITIYNITVVSGSIIVSFFATTSNPDTLAEFSSAVTMGGLLDSFTYNGMTLNLTSAIQDPNYPIIYPTEPPKKDAKYFAVVIVSIAVGSAILLAMCVLTFGLFCYYGTRKVSKQNRLKVKPIENDYEQYHMSTVYRNSPIFDEDGDYPLFHIVKDDNNQLSLAKDVSQPASRSSTMESLDKAEKSYHEKAMHMSSKEIKVGEQVTVFDNPQMTQGDYEDKMSLDELIQLSSLNNNNNNNNNNSTMLSPPPVYSECHPNSVTGSEVSIPPSYRSSPVSNTYPLLSPEPVHTVQAMPLGVAQNELPPIRTPPKTNANPGTKLTDETIHGLKVTTFN